MDMWHYENELHKQGYDIIAGTDEAGRGPLFGPVVAACVALPKDFHLEGLNDSKKLSEKKRNEFYKYLTKKTIYGIGIVNAEEIDKINIYEASRKAMMLAIKEVQKQICIECVLSDAMPMDINIPVIPIIKGDAKSMSIAAASVIAKVTRDKIMYEIDKKHPEYDFKNHKGYPTQSHMEAIEKYGLIEGYRKTYAPVQNYIETGNCKKGNQNDNKWK